MADAGLHRRIDRLARDYARRDALDRAVHLAADCTLAVDRLAERVDHAANQLLADRHRNHAPGRVDLVALFNAQVVAEDDRADRTLLEVQRDAIHWLAAPGLDRELEQLGGHGLLEPLDACHAIAYRHDGADVDELRAQVGAGLNTF
jgi:hypothetical protein